MGIPGFLATSFFLIAGDEARSWSFLLRGLRGLVRRPTLETPGESLSRGASPSGFGGVRVDSGCTARGEDGDVSLHFSGTGDPSLDSMSLYSSVPGFGLAGCVSLAGSTTPWYVIPVLHCHHFSASTSQLL